MSLQEKVVKVIDTVFLSRGSRGHCIFKGCRHCRCSTSCRSSCKVVLKTEIVES